MAGTKDERDGKSARKYKVLQAAALAMAVLDRTDDESGCKMEQWKTKFPAFPYEPYSIQIDFMNALYQSLDKGGIAMLESPTGTGKTLSVICGAFQWLVDRRKRPISTSEEQCCSDDEPDWMKNFVVNKDNQPERKKIASQKKGSNHKVKGGGGCMDLLGNGGKSELEIGSANGKKENSVKNGSLEVNDEDFLLDEYESEGEEGGEKSKRKGNGVWDSSSSDDEGNEFCGQEEKTGLKIYFCSRTHSQLSQFIKELKKTVFGSELSVIALGSRKNFCTNEEVLALGNPGRINERCLELQKSKKDQNSKIKNLRAGGGKRRTKVSSGCPMLRKRSAQKEFKETISQLEALDIEDLVQLGRSLGTCPYYGSRNMVPSADIVVLPYQSLLSKSSREALGLSLKNNIVIIDEAHNLADSLISMYDSKITLSQLNNVHSCLEKYHERFCNLLGPGNRRYIQTLVVLTQSFLRVIRQGKETNEGATHFGAEKAPEAKTATESSVTINDFLFSLNIDNINFVKLIHYVKESNIIHKVSGYGDKALALQKQNTFSGDEGSTLSGFQSLVDILLALVNSNTDGRIIISRPTSTSSGEQEGSIRYVMLTGEKIFSEIAKQAHAVVLTGGTLQPIEETRERLFPWLSPSQFHFFSCSHIVPRESILPMAVSHGPSGLSFDFSYGSRGSQKMVEELGRLLGNLVTVVPEGIVVFFSSFEYEGKVHDSWKASGILQRITRKKRLFREPRSNAEVEIVLKDYKETIDRLSSKEPKEGQQSQNGAILLAVVGGKISEGINFSDGMGRCIVMVGLPYPSPSDIVLTERIKHMEGLRDEDSILQDLTACDVSGDVQSGFEVLRRCKRRGREYYENLCMKAVNQSIGRAIRHINDYAAILLVDSRYASSHPSKGRSYHPVHKLPLWIKDCLVSATGGYGEVHRQLNQFFKHNKQKRQT